MLDLPAARATVRKAAIWCTQESITKPPGQATASLRHWLGKYLFLLFMGMSATRSICKWHDSCSLHAVLASVQQMAAQGMEWMDEERKLSRC